MTKSLDDYMGHPVHSAAVQIRNTGDGLSQALAIDPEVMPLESIVHVVLECVVEKHRYDPIKDTNGYQIVNMLRAERATFIDREHVEKFLDATEEAIADAEGEPQLAFIEGDQGGEIVGVSE